MNQPDIQLVTSKITMLLKVVENIQGVSLKGCFLDIAKLRGFLADSDYSSALSYVIHTQETIASFKLHLDIVQIFEKIERYLLINLLYFERYYQQDMAYIVIDTYEAVSRYSREFQLAMEYEDTEIKRKALNEVIEGLQADPFKGSDMIITLINLLLDSNERVGPLLSRVNKDLA
jgi:archaellum biogenesis ATPase FlaH